MTIDEAIKIKELAKDDPDSIDVNDLQDADDLSIEALKRLGGLRPYQYACFRGLLPGETKD